MSRRYWNLAQSNHWQRSEFVTKIYPWSCPFILCQGLGCEKTKKLQAKKPWQIIFSKNLLATRKPQNMNFEKGAGEWFSSHCSRP
jgi:hypothetical protein